MTQAELARLLARNSQLSVAGQPAAQSAPIPPVPKTTRLERTEQGIFANECLRRELPFSWHATNARSRATPGTPDFWVGIAARGAWIEFKRDRGASLSLEQARFFSLCAKQGIACYVVYSAAEAIQLLNRLSNPTAPLP